jgi:hypothetical protein
MVSILVDTFDRRVNNGTFPKPVVLEGKRLWHRGRLSEALDRLDPAFATEDEPIMAASRAQTKERRATEAPPLQRRRDALARRFEFKTAERLAVSTDCYQDGLAL